MDEVEIVEIVIKIILSVGLCCVMLLALCALAATILSSRISREIEERQKHGK